jgi:nucleoside-diphosphate-sugar epimerase
MKILLLGHSGYIGKYLATLLRETVVNCQIESFPRNELDFSKNDIETHFSSLIKKLQPSVIINCIGGIDSGSFSDVQRLYISNFLPTFLLYDFYKTNSLNNKTLIIILGSKAAGEPRAKYPLYAATKGAELALSRTAEELFNGTLVNWKYLVVPRLKGGLGFESYPTLESDDKLDSALSEIGESIRSLIHSEHGRVPSKITGAN